MTMRRAADEIEHLRSRLEEVEFKAHEECVRYETQIATLLETQRKFGTMMHEQMDKLAEAEALLREARDDVVEASNHTHKPHAVAYYKDQIARIDAFLTLPAAHKEGKPNE